jgi:hypothetical protein
MMSVQPISPRFGAGIVTAAGREHRGFLAPLPSRHIATARVPPVPPRPGRNTIRHKTRNTPATATECAFCHHVALLTPEGLFRADWPWREIKF